MLNNLRQAQDIVATLEPILEKAKMKLAIDDNAVFHRWLEEEFECLTRMQTAAVSERERLEMAYVDILKKLNHAECVNYQSFICSVLILNQGLVH